MLQLSVALLLVQIHPIDNGGKIVMTRKKEIRTLAQWFGVDEGLVQTLYRCRYDGDNEEKESGSSNSVAPSAAEKSAAMAAGLLHEPVEMTHDEVVAATIAARDKLDRKLVADSFIAGISRGRTDLISTLGSYATLVDAKEHAFEKGNYAWCEHCGLKQWEAIDRDSMNLLRWRSLGGGGSPEHDYALVDFEQFARFGQVSPTAEEKAGFRKLLNAIRDLPEAARTSDLLKLATEFVPGSAGIGPGKKYCCIRILEILGWCGILKPAVVSWTPGQSMEPQDLRPMGVRINPEWQYPACGWCGADGVNEAAVDFWFPGFAGKSRPQAGHVEATLRKGREKQHKEKRTAARAVAKAAERPVSNRWPEIGDVYGIPLSDGRWGACRIINRFEDLDPFEIYLGPCFYVASSSWVGDELPTIDEPELREILIVSHHDRTRQEIVCVQHPPPRSYPKIGQLPPTDAEKQIRIQHLGGWELGPAIRIQWRLKHERERVLADAQGQLNAPQLAAKIAREWNERTATNARLTLAQFRQAARFEDWHKRVPQQAIQDVRDALNRTIDQLEALGASPPKRQLTKPLRDFADRVIELNRQHDFFVYRKEYDDLCDTLRDLAGVIGLAWNGPEIGRVLMRMQDHYRFNPLKKSIGQIVSRF